MFDLFNSQLKLIYRSYAKEYGVYENIIYRTVPILERILQDGIHLTKQEISDIICGQLYKDRSELIEIEYIHSSLNYCLVEEL
jgi:hypothetical protein